MKALSRELVCSFINGDFWLNSQFVVTIWYSRVLPEGVIWVLSLVLGELVLGMSWLDVPHGRRGEPSMWAPISKCDYVALTIYIISDLLQLEGWDRLLQVSPLQSDGWDTGRTCVLSVPLLTGRPLSLVLNFPIFKLFLTLRSLWLQFFVLFNFSVSIAFTSSVISCFLSLHIIWRVSLMNSLLFLACISRLGSGSAVRPYMLRWL